MLDNTSFVDIDLRHGRVLTLLRWCSVGVC